jgi:hypothetical protein
MAPLSLVDYVVAHEVCHLKLKNHSRAFWQLLCRLMPDYDRRRDRLRTLGVQFEGSSGFLVGDFHSFGSMQVRILSRRYSSSRNP